MKDNKIIRRIIIGILGCLIIIVGINIYIIGDTINHNIGYTSRNIIFLLISLIIALTGGEVVVRAINDSKPQNGYLKSHWFVRIVMFLYTFSGPIKQFILKR